MNTTQLVTDHFVNFINQNCPRLQAHSAKDDKFALCFAPGGRYYEIFLRDGSLVLKCVWRDHATYLPSGIPEFVVLLADPTGFDQLEHKLLELNNLV